MTFFFQAEDGIRYIGVTGVQTCALPISLARGRVWDLSPALCRRLVVLAVVGYVLLFTVFSGLKYVWFGQGHDLVLHEQRSEERRVGKEGRSRWSPYH